MKIFYTIALFILFLGSTFQVNASQFEPADSSKILYNTTFKLIEKSLFDSALFTIRQAFAYGLSDDSLFYAWAEIYSTKGALDTAIALSLAVKVGHEHSLYYAVLKQRYLLYTLTNQTDRAEALFDTINRLPGYRVRYLIPEIKFFLKGGVQQNSTKEAEILPYYLDYAYPEDEPARGVATGGLNLQWNLPIRKSMGFEVSAGANLYQYNPPKPFKIKNAFDSSYSEGHATICYYLLSGMISGGYTVSSVFGYSGEISVKHNAALDVSTFVRDFFLYGNAGYSYDIDRQLHNWNGMFFVSHDWSSRRSNSISLSVNGVHVKSDTLFISDSYVKVYTDGTALYFDSLCTQAIDRPVLSTRNLSRGVNTILPRSYINAKVSISQQFELKHGFSIGATINGATTRFIGDYTWVDSLYSASDLPELYGNPTLVVNSKDGRSFWAIRWKPLELDSLTKVNRTIHQKKRIDQTITANVNFRKSFKKIVTIGLDGSLSRTFSNMENYAPVDIPVWSYCVMLSTTFNFNPAGKLR